MHLPIQARSTAWGQSNTRSSLPVKELNTRCPGGIWLRRVSTLRSDLLRALVSTWRKLKYTMARTKNELICQRAGFDEPNNAQINIPSNNVRRSVIKLRAELKAGSSIRVGIKRTPAASRQQS